MEQILLKQLTNEELTAEEKLKFDQWLAASGKNRQIYNQMKLIIKGPSKTIDEIKDETWFELMDQIKTSTRKTKPEMSRLKLGVWTKIMVLKCT